MRTRCRRSASRCARLAMVRSRPVALVADDTVVTYTGGHITLMVTDPVHVMWRRAHPV